MVVTKSQIRPRFKKFVLSNADVLTLPTVTAGGGLILVPAAGASAFLIPLWAEFIFHNVQDVTGIDDPGGVLNITGSLGSIGLSLFIENTGGGRNDITKLLAAGAGDVNATTALQASPQPLVDTPGLNFNTPIRLQAQNTLDYTGGDPANTLTIWLSYQIVNA